MWYAVQRPREGIATTSPTGVTTAYAYDGLGRQRHVTDGRGNVTQTSYDASGRVEWVQDGAENQTDYAYYTTSDSGDGAYPGRLKSIQNAAAKLTYFGYDGRGRTTRTWGHVPYPTQSVYDDYGQRVSLKTYRSGSDQTWSASTWPASPPAADETTWSYDAATGLLESKTDADGKSVVYTYTQAGRLHTRRWARNAADQKVTTYTYDASTGGVR